MISKLVVFFYLMSFSTISSAVVLEPLVSYQAGKIDEGTPFGKASLNGPSFGLRFGLRFKRYYEIGTEVSYGQLEQEYQQDPQVIYDATHSQVGAYFAGNFSVCRAWAGFYFLNQVDLPSKDQRFNGTGTKVGVGIPVANRFHVNLDYLIHNFTDVETSLGGSSVPYYVGSELVDFNVSTVTLSLSYLLNI